MLSTATLDAAQASTTGEVADDCDVLPVLLSPLVLPDLLLAPRGDCLPVTPDPTPTPVVSSASATAASINEVNAFVFPVPGGPCQMDKVLVKPRLTASCCESFKCLALVVCMAALILPPKSLVAQGGGTDARDAMFLFTSFKSFASPSGMPISARCSGAYAVEVILVACFSRFWFVSNPGIPDASENATSACNARSCETVFALKSNRSLPACNKMPSSSSSTAIFKKCIARSTTIPVTELLPLSSHSSPSTRVTMSPWPNR
mmetsp:Transcript_3605/g.12202  ORF Transcript_3605/g.12202 Transcript_3605/m.12202 type:complete len:261 (-) Transcript_3605:1010-1792(-)